MKIDARTIGDVHVLDCSGKITLGGAVGDAINGCSFEQLLQLLNRQLDPDGQLEVYDHLARCDICRDAVYQLSRDRHGALLLFRTT